MPTAVRTQQMAQFAGCRRWPWTGKMHAGSSFQTPSADDSTSFHSLVNPLWAASFWQNVDASLKQGVRLAHQKSHAVTIPDGLLRWSYGLTPDVSPPAKIDWRRGASRRRRRSNRGSSSEFLLSVDDADADGGGGHADGAHDDNDAGDDDADDDVDDGGIGNAADDVDDGRSCERDHGHDGRHDGRGGGVHHNGNYDDGDVDGHQAFDSNANDGHDDDFEHGDANSGDDQDAHDQYDDRNDDRTDY
jgi:hypothetical protein